MNPHRQTDPLAKKLLRGGYSLALGTAALLNTMVPRDSGVSVFYGGARVGDVGGPLVKVQRLRRHFPERRWGYSVVYSLSNAPYLPPLALRVLKARGVPIVHNQNGVFYPGWYEGNWQGQNARMAHAYHQADHVFYQSIFCRDTANRYLGERKGSGEILYNAVDTGHFSPATVRKGRPLTILLTGKIGNHLFYRLESTLRGLALARQRGLDAALRISGWVEAEALAQAQTLAVAEGVADHVVFTGPYTQQQAPEVYRQADVYVMTKHNDPCPNTVLEALACGLPVIYSRSGGVPELVGDEAGIGVDVPQGFDRSYAPAVEDIAAAFLAVAEKAPILAQAARQRAVDRFDISHWLDRHSQVFTALLEGRTP